MFRWNLMLRKLFPSLPHQSKARRPNATVKPHVEELTPRILPSASSLPVVAVASPPAVPSVAAITSYVSSMMELRSQLIATIEQDLSSAFNTIGQDIAQVLSSVGRQWDNPMGINPSTPNASPNTSVTQSDSGMGRGNSSGVGRGRGALAATQNSQNQTLNNATQQTSHSSGSGSNATTASDADAPPHRLMKAQPLTSPGSGSITGDTYQWDPGVGYIEWGLGSGGGGYVSTHIYTPMNLLAGNPVNWLKNGNVQSVPLGQQPTVPGNKPGDTAVLGYGSAAAGLQPIEWNGNFTFSTLSLENSYTAQETIDAGDTLELTGVVNETSLTMAGATKLYEYLENNSTITAKENEAIGNMTLAGDPTGVFNIAGGTTTIAGNPGAGNPAYQERTGVIIQVSPGATLTDLGYNSLQFTNSGLAINVYGTMNVNYGTGTGLLLMDNNGYKNNYINVSGSSGTLKYLGAGGVTDTFTVPVYVRGGGTFYLSVSAFAQNDNGKLIVQNLSGYTFPNNLKNSVYMDGAASSVQLRLGDTLECDQDYYQNNGTLETLDTTTCTLQDGPNGALGTATIAAGNLILAASNQATYGQLTVSCKTLSFNGLYIVAINGQSGANGNYDWINVTGTTSLGANSALKVYVNNAPPVNGTSWPIIQDGQGNNIQLPAGQPNFQMPITSNPQTNLNGGVNPKDKTQYLLSF